MGAQYRETVDETSGKNETLLAFFDKVGSSSDCLHALLLTDRFVDPSGPHFSSGAWVVDLDQRQAGEI